MTMSLLSQLFQLLIVEVISDRNRVLVPRSPLVRLIPADEQNCCSAGVNGKQDSKVPGRRPQFLHRGMSRTLYPVDKRTPETRSFALKVRNSGNNGILVRF
jgi:hypothetical protein